MALGRRTCWSRRARGCCRVENGEGGDTGDFQLERMMLMEVEESDCEWGLELEGKDVEMLEMGESEVMGLKVEGKCDAGELKVEKSGTFKD